MKYNININQFAIIGKLKLDMDLFDAVVLDYLYWICASVSKKVHLARVEKDGELFTWINYSHFSKENPILKIKSKCFLSSRIDKLEKIGLIKTFVSSGFHKRKYVLITDLTELVYSDTAEKMDKKENDVPVLPGEHPVLPGEQVPVLPGEHIIILTNHNTKSISAKADSANAESFDFQKKLQEMRDSDRKDMKIIALYWKRKEFIFTNQKQYQAALKRELRAAKLLEGYDGKQIGRAITWCVAKYPDWSLETVHTKINDVIKNT